MSDLNDYPELVFRLELPIEEVVLKTSKKTLKTTKGRLAPTLNEYAGMPAFKRALVRAALDKRIIVERAAWPRWNAIIDATYTMGTKKPAKAGKAAPKRKVIRKVVKGEKRAVVVTRHSSASVDEISVDIAGGKMPVDRLVQAGILAGDSAKWLVRKAHHEKAAPGAGRVVIEVFAALVEEKRG